MRILHVERLSDAKTTLMGRFTILKSSILTPDHNATSLAQHAVAFHS